MFYIRTITNTCYRVTEWINARVFMV